MTTLYVKPSEARSAITLAIRAGLVPMMHGSPAIGKSSIVHKIAEQFNLKMIDLRLSQCDPTDLLGFPSIANNKASYVPMDTFPVAGDPLPVKVKGVSKGDSLPDGTVAKEDVKESFYGGWLLFLDELPLAPPAVQAAAYKLILDRMVGAHPLHKKVAIVGAGNLESDNAMVQPMSTALQSRMVHLSLRMDQKEWLDWAMEAGIDYRITSYIAFRPEVLYSFKPEHSDHTYASPRTWEFADRVLKVDGNVRDLTVRALLSGCISEGIAAEFISYSEIESSLPKMVDIIADPEHTKVPEDPSVLYLMSGAIGSKTTKDNLEHVAKYVMRMPAEFQVVSLREIIRRNVSLMGHPSIQKWVAKAGATLF
jgi:hypothetical protein